MELIKFNYHWESFLEKHAISERLKQLGVNLSSNKLSFIFEKFKEIAKNKKVSDKDVLKLVKEIKYED